MRTLKTTLKLCTQAFQADWDVAFQAVALAYRATPHTVTGHTPFFLGTGQEVDVPTQPASRAPRRLRPKDMRPRRRVSGLTAKLMLFFSSESLLRTEPCEDLAVRLSF